MSLYLYRVPEGFGLTSSYHDGGGVVVSAASEQRAETLLRSKLSKLEDDAAVVFLPFKVFYTSNMGTASEEVIIFPDVGCC